MSLDNLVEAVLTGGGVQYNNINARRYSDSCAEVLTAEERRRLLQYRYTSRLGISSVGPPTMDDRDKRIYNSLGDTSGSKGKVFT